MSTLRMQPTFTMDLPLTLDVATQRIRSAITSLGTSTRARAAGRCIEIGTPPGETRFWSPHLSVQISEQEPDFSQKADLSLKHGTLLHARFSPRPEIWTFCMFLYFAMAIVILGGLLVGYVQWSLGAAPTGLWAVPAGMLVIGGLHSASLIGQGLSRHQMIDLREQLNEILVIALRDATT